jgi:hypothetical protein
MPPRPVTLIALPYIFTCIILGLLLYIDPKNEKSGSPHQYRGSPFDLRQWQADFLLATVSRSALGPIQPPIYHIHLVPRLRMHRVIFTHPGAFVWPVAILSDNFTCILSIMSLAVLFALFCVPTVHWGLQFCSNYWQFCSTLYEVV